MTVTVRDYRKSKRVGFEVDIRFAWPDGSFFRRRFRAAVSTRSQALAWGKAREVEIIANGKAGDLARSRRDEPDAQPAAKEVPTLEKFAPRFIDGYAKANKQKASTVDTKERILRKHLLPLLRKKRLDAITNEDVQRVKAALAARSRKTVNNVINVLSKLLNVAVEWNVLERLPCTIKLLKVDSPTPKFYEFDEYSRLVNAAEKIDRRVLLTVLLGGHAGLRRGEILALRWSNVDLRRKQLKIERSVWQGVEDVPKSGRGRIIPMTEALASALTAHRHLRGPYVLCHEGGSSVDENTAQDWIEQATKRANLEAMTCLDSVDHRFLENRLSPG